MQSKYIEKSLAMTNGIGIEIRSSLKEIYIIRIQWFLKPTRHAMPQQQQQKLHKYIDRVRIHIYGDKYNPI